MLINNPRDNSQHHCTAMSEFSNCKDTSKVSSEGEGEEGSHYNNEGMATKYESAFFYDNLEYRDW